MYATLLFWTALTLPGYVVAKRYYKEDVRSGLPGTVAVSFLMSLGMLSPISLVCYWIQAPIAVLTVACILLIVGAVVAVTKIRAWGELGRLLAGGLTLEAAIVGFDLLLAARVGAFLGGDAVVHLARVRVLYDHGFNNWDPFVGAPHFFPPYHTNIYHALLASLSALTGIHPLDIWFASLVWAKVLIAGGAYYLAWCVFERPWAAWAAVACTVGAIGSKMFLLYPNKLAPYFVVPCMIGFVVRAARPSSDWRPVLQLAVGSLVLGQLHSLYGAFVALMLAPALICLAAWRLPRHRPGGEAALACVAALAAFAPFLWLSNASAALPESAGETRAVAALPPGADARTAAPAEHDEATSGAPRPDWRFLAGAVGVLVGMRGSRRRELSLVGGAMLCAAVILYLPGPYALAVRAMRSAWIVNRLEFVVFLGFVIGVAGTLSTITAAPVPSRWTRLLVIVVSVALGILFQPPEQRRGWLDYLLQASEPSSVRMASRNRLKQTVERCRRYISQGECILTDDWSGMVLAMAYDCRIVAPRRGSMGLPDLGRRRADLDRMLSDDTPWPERRRLLRKYGIRYVYPSGTPMAWINTHLQGIRGEPGFPLAVLNTDE